MGDALCPEGPSLVLKASHLQEFAELCGFDGSSDQWMAEYHTLCAKYRWNKSVGVTFAEFAAFVNDESSNGYCSDKELLSLAVVSESRKVDHEESSKVEPDSDSS